MRARPTLILTLVLSLFLSTQVFPYTAPAETPARACATMQCPDCGCPDSACCAAMDQHHAPAPIHATSRVDIQLAPLKLRDFAPLYFLPPSLRSLALCDDTQSGFASPLLAMICVRLI